MTISIDPGLLFAVPVLLLILPFRWLLAVFAAAAIHELFHILAVTLSGGRIHSLQIGIGGAIIGASVTAAQETFCAILAGPLGSFSLLLLWHYWPELAICGGMHGLYNLIPVRTMDGGRLLYELLCLWIPDKAEKVMSNIESIIHILILLAPLTILFLRIYELLPPVILLLISLIRKRPCKPDRIGVQ